MVSHTLEKYITNLISHKGSVSRIYKKSQNSTVRKQTNNKNVKLNTNFKWAISMNGTFATEDTQITNKRIKIYHH